MYTVCFQHLTLLTHDERARVVLRHAEGPCPICGYLLHYHDANTRFPAVVPHMLQVMRLRARDTRPYACRQ